MAARATSWTPVEFLKIKEAFLVYAGSRNTELVIDKLGKNYITGMTVNCPPTTC